MGDVIEKEYTEESWNLCNILFFSMGGDYLLINITLYILLCIYDLLHSKEFLVIVGLIGVKAYF